MGDNWNNNTLTIDELYGPPLNLENATQMRLAFKYAFAGQFLTTNNSKLQIQISRNCESSWSTRLTIAGDDLETAPPQSDPFIPNETQWMLESINIPNSYLEDGFRFRFKFTSEGNNRLFVDDINVDVTASIADLSAAFSDVFLYPNPTSNQLSVKFSLTENSAVKFTVVDLLGQTVLVTEQRSFSVGEHTHQLPLNKLTEGLYLLRLETEKGISV
ncbi:MAG: T9SS type A sorting domain-containing protein [Flavobacteriales bacterium]|nr:T9SS type A sorting domain-containing protein [Flavobacteriales bacterium]